MKDIKITVSYYVEADGNTFSLDDEKIDLLSSISKTGSISAAAREVGISYRTAQNFIKRLESTLNTEIVTSAKGGKNKGGTSLNNVGFFILKECRKIKTIYEFESEKLFNV